MDVIVGIGRPFLYAYSSYGPEGIDQALTILRVSAQRDAVFFITYSVTTQDEFEMNMRLLGAPTMKDVVSDMVDADSIHQHVVAVPGDRLYDTNCKLPSIFSQTRY